MAHGKDVSEIGNAVRLIAAAHIAGPYLAKIMELERVSPDALAEVLRKKGALKKAAQFGVEVASLIEDELWSVSE